MFVQNMAASFLQKNTEIMSTKKGEKINEWESKEQIQAENNLERD